MFFAPTLALGIATGNFIPSALDFSVVGGSAALGVAHGVVHGLLENATDGAKEAIQHNRTCDQIENALCENPELLQQAAIDKAASYQFDQEPAPSRTAKTIIQQAEARRAGAGELLASQSPAPSGARGL